MVELNQWIKIKAPATVANMVCGFDILGFAVNNPYDAMEMRLVARDSSATDFPSAIKIINIDDYNLPTDPEKNVAGAALIALIEAYEEQVGLGNSKATIPVGQLAFQVKINKLIIV